MHRFYLICIGEKRGFLSIKLKKSTINKQKPPPRHSPTEMPVKLSPKALRGVRACVSFNITGKTVKLTEGSSSAM